MLQEIRSGEWESAPHMTDYRTEQLSDMVVERATWLPSTPAQDVDGVQIAGEGYIWLRFWLLNSDQVIDKYFAPTLEPVGIHVPICMPIRRKEGAIFTMKLFLSLWIDAESRVTVLGEEEFEQAAAGRQMAPIEVEHAEFRIRELTLLTAQQRFPPAIVRNFTLDLRQQGSETVS